MSLSHDPPRGSTVTLREVIAENRADVIALRVTESQQAYVDGTGRSIDEAEATPGANPWYRAVYAEDTAVGFVMLGDDVPADNDVIPYRYYLWRMLIDHRFQGCGFGRAALDLVTDYVRTRPGADALVTSVVPGAESPLDFYVRYGFEPTGAWWDHEQVLSLDLAAGAPRR